MEDYNFSIVSTTDVRKLLKVADVDKDGMLSMDDFDSWVNSSMSGLEGLGPKKGGGSLDDPKKRARRGGSLDLPTMNNEALGKV